jgi:hypothetical protein
MVEERASLITEDRIANVILSNSGLATEIDLLKKLRANCA